LKEDKRECVGLAKSLGIWPVTAGIRKKKKK